MNLVLDLFPGLELLGSAFREAGFCVVSGPDKLLGTDIRDFRPPPRVFDGIIGGSPCQSFSALVNLVRVAHLRRLGLRIASGSRGDVRDVVDGTGLVVFEGALDAIDAHFGVGPGNLVPEFEWVVEEAEPRWFLHENVRRAPIPHPRGYAVADFLICNSSIEGPDGLGYEQERERRFTFGVRGPGPAPNLLHRIPRAALRLPAASRTQAVAADAPAVPVALGGSGKPKRVRVPPLTGENGTKYETPRTRQPAITGANPCARRPKGGHGERRTVAEMLRLQGLLKDLLDGAPTRRRRSAN